MMKILHLYLISLMGDQKKIFEEAVKNLAYFGNSKTYVSDQELLKVVEEIETIVKDSKPLVRFRDSGIK